MGLFRKRWKTPNVELKDGTTLVELEIRNINDAHLIQGIKPDSFTPVTLCPRRSWPISPAGWYMNIPEGFFAIVIEFGKNKGVYDAGLHYMPPWKRVSHLVTKQMIIFDTPVKDCKTADNVTVNLDVMIVFEIVDPNMFVFKLGPEKLDGLLRAAQEEALRSMASSVTADKVFELQGTNTTTIIEEMNSKFTPRYGVVIRNMTVKNVRLPMDLMRTWEKKTVFVSKEIESQRKQELQMLKMNNKNALDKMDENLKVEKQQAEEQYVTNRARLDKEIASIKSTTHKEVSGIRVDAEAKKKEVISRADLEVSKLKNDRDQVQRDVQLVSASERRDIMADAHTYRKQKEAEANYEVAKNRAVCLEAIAEAEGCAATAFVAKRDFEVQMERLEIYKNMADNKGIKIATNQENIMGLAPRNDAVVQLVQKGIAVANQKLNQLGGKDPSASDLSSILFGGKKKTRGG